MTATAKPVTLDPLTLAAFDAYILQWEKEMGQTLDRGPFLWSDLDGKRAQRLREGRIEPQFWTGKAPVKVHKGLIHDWIAAVHIPEATIRDVFAVIQDYDNHKNIYRPEVIDSKLVSRRDDNFQIYLRVLKKKIITVVLDTDHDVCYRRLDRMRWECRSITTRIAEVENAGSPKERVMPADSGYGFLWRLFSYWRFQERNADVIVECRAISLTRDVPLGLGWAIEPIIQKLPKESLSNTLEATRRALGLAMHPAKS
jgi:hypothetical protein